MVFAQVIFSVVFESGQIFGRHFYKKVIELKGILSYTLYAYKYNSDVFNWFSNIVQLLIHCILGKVYCLSNDFTELIYSPVLECLYISD